MKYKVEFAEFHKIEVEADSKKEAEEKAGTNSNAWADRIRERFMRVV